MCVFHRFRAVRVSDAATDIIIWQRQTTILRHQVGTAPFCFSQERADDVIDNRQQT